MKRVLLLLLIVMCGCRNKTYYIHIITMSNEEHIDTIKASSDSVAYAKGYKYFKIGEFVEKGIKDTIQNCAIGTYKSFFVTDSRNKTIEYKLSGKAKYELEQKAKYTATPASDGE